MFAKATVFDRENKQELEISIFTVVYKVNGKVTRLFHLEAQIQDEISGGERFLEPLGDLSEQALFLW